MARVVVLIVLLSAVTSCFCGRRLECFQCFSFFQIDKGKDDPCYNARGKNLTIVACEKGDACMKLVFNASPDYLIYRDCADKEESCDDFLKRLPRQLPKFIQGTIRCASCKNSLCNASNIITYCPLYLLALFILNKLII